MKLAALAAAAAILGLALAAPATGPSDGLDVDTDLPDGHYSITVFQNGSQHVRRRDPEGGSWHTLAKRQGTHEYTFLVDDAAGRVVDVALDSYSKQRLPLPDPQTQCVHHRPYGTLNYPLIADDYRASKLSLYHFCDAFKFVEGHVSMALNGNVMVYVCQRRVTTLRENTCAEAEYKAAEALMNASCGEAAGYVWISAWNKEYGRMWKGERPCRRWNAMTPIWRKGSGFKDPKGQGRVDRNEPDGNFGKTPEELYMEAAWEPLRLTDEEDDGQRQDFRPLYGQYVDGWGNNFNWPSHEKYGRPPNADKGMPLEEGNMPFGPGYVPLEKGKGPLEEANMPVRREIESVSRLGPEETAYTCHTQDDKKRRMRT